nr:immunoglobulin heavy chain junction region [Macaca mulatta]MOW86548.1 immunoglobulin heavy chain junction region [Macaca mulatta]MOW86598.1 immunoglobulin heavy chain junction region [Macaca mulatta]MOW86894.1 immunoglobulin heavy chain junction region [Macaca mulatta]MOW86957.1 immunoglobulin heavy chain junction region [Macaca mulatta]
CGRINFWSGYYYGYLDLW